MSTSRRRAALAAFPVALGLLLAGPAVGAASAAPVAAQPDAAGQARDCLLCVGHHHHHHHHGHINILGLHLGLWLHL